MIVDHEKFIKQNKSSALNEHLFTANHNQANVRLTRLSNVDSLKKFRKYELVRVFELVEETLRNSSVVTLDYFTYTSKDKRLKNNFEELKLILKAKGLKNAKVREKCTD